MLYIIYKYLYTILHYFISGIGSTTTATGYGNLLQGYLASGIFPNRNVDSIPAAP